MASADRAVAGGASEGRRRWLLAGQHLLREGGIPAVKLVAMVDETGLTTGSFHHHFDGMGSFLDELASFYGSERPRELLDRIDATDPRDRLEQLVRLDRDERMRPLDRAMRDWAGSSNRAADAVRASDERLLRFMESAFRELGHGRDDARLRAIVLLSVGAARVHSPWPRQRRASKRLLDLLAAPGQRSRDDRSDDHSQVHSRERASV